jgi:hypothetical protein
MTNRNERDESAETPDVMHETIGNPTSDDDHIEEIAVAEQENETGSGYTRKEE